MWRVRIYLGLGLAMLVMAGLVVLGYAVPEAMQRTNAEPTWAECVSSVGEDVCAVELGLVEDEQGDGVLGDR